MVYKLYPNIFVAMANSTNGYIVQYFEAVDTAEKFTAVLGAAVVTKYSTVVLFWHVPAP